MSIGTKLKALRFSIDISEKDNKDKLEREAESIKEERRSLLSTFGKDSDYF